MRTPAIIFLVIMAIVAIFCFHFSFLVVGMIITALFFLCLAQEIIEVISKKIKN